MTGAPKDLEIFQRGAGREIVRRWFNDRTIQRTVLAVLWNGFVIPFYLVMRSHSAAQEGLSLFHLVLYAFPAVGVLLAYRAAAEWLNRTWIVFDLEHVSVRHEPLPWPGNRTLAAAQVKRLHTAMSSWVTGKGEHRRYTYDVLVDTLDGKTLKLVGGFTDLDQAVRVKQEIDGHLGLKPAQGAPQNDQAQEAPQSVPAPDDRDTQFEPRLESVQQGDPAATGPRDPETNIQSVLAIWLFILLWNGVIWGVAWMLWDSPSLKNRGVASVFFALFALIGFALICFAIPSTWRFFRHKSVRPQKSASGNSGWKVVIALLVIAAGFAAILTFGMLKRSEQDALRRQLLPPPTWHK